jgi:aspartate/methionine/tyrosine aminotransferase
MKPTQHNEMIFDKIQQLAAQLIGIDTVNLRDDVREMRQQNQKLVETDNVLYSILSKAEGFKVSERDGTVYLEVGK